MAHYGPRVSCQQTWPHLNGPRPFQDGFKISKVPPPLIGHYQASRRYIPEQLRRGSEQEQYKHFYAKDESTHPSMVSTHQHIFKGKMCKNVETVSTHVKSVSTRVAVDTLSEQVDTRSRFQNSQFEELGQQVDTLSEQVDTGSSSQNNLLHILDSASTLPLGQVDTLRKLFILKVDGCHVSL
ncbi:hypothetical protein Taro_004805 [Colocasia esculenta]|uniref:Uncharacterized protein n=1 Tax=Colocasia esculenta TaxID=4460 RepID=A0A843TNC0_COLES|nr:hypothetical protein [Colocasia esculenta]